MSPYRDLRQNHTAREEQRRLGKVCKDIGSNAALNPLKRTTPGLFIPWAPGMGHKRKRQTMRRRESITVPAESLPKTN